MEAQLLSSVRPRCSSAVFLAPSGSPAPGGVSSPPPPSPPLPPPLCLHFLPPLSAVAPAVGAGGDAVVPSARGAAKLGLHVLGGRVERRLCLCRAAPAEVGGPSLALCFPGPGGGWGVPHSAFRVSSSHRPLFQGYSEMQQLLKIFE